MKKHSNDEQASGFCKILTQFFDNYTLTYTQQMKHVYNSFCSLHPLLSLSKPSHLSQVLHLCQYQIQSFGFVVCPIYFNQSLLHDHSVGTVQWNRV